ncbi:hypothetical protein [Nocardia vaccinii]|uniref:hypothetical protein n=1 Tax=Nocardia vaccinii TaxID=1822 RepID=UPI000836793B|nr:hypothetical protein [Nocardia vaccinii]
MADNDDAEEPKRVNPAGATAAVSADSGHAVALVFVDQVTTADDLKQPTTMSSSLRPELVKIGEHWLVDKLDTV